MKKFNRVCLILSIIGFALCMTACGPADQVLALLPIISGILGILGVAGDAILPGEAALINTVVAAVQTGLKALADTIKAYEASPTGTGALAKVVNTFTAVQTDLQSLLSATQVKNAVFASKLTNIVNAVFTALAGIEGTLVGKNAQTVAAAQVNQTGS